jgi:hypothetical protein
MEFSKANLWFIAFLCLLAAVLFLALAPESATPVGSWDIPDKLEHIAAFTALGITLRPGTPRLPLAAQFCLLSAIGAGIEVIQALTPFSRQADIVDSMASSLGAGLGLAAVLFLETRRALFQARADGR